MDIRSADAASLWGVGLVKTTGSTKSYLPPAPVGVVKTQAASAPGKVASQQLGGTPLASIFRLNQLHRRRLPAGGAQVRKNS